MTRHFTAARQRSTAGMGALRPPLDLIRTLHRAFRQWQWRGARPFVHLTDHLRRDIGLPPLDDRNRSY